MECDHIIANRDILSRFPQYGARSVLPDTMKTAYYLGRDQVGVQAAQAQDHFRAACQNYGIADKQSPD
jgi:hypothetical protein